MPALAALTDFCAFVFGHIQEIAFHLAVSLLLFLPLFFLRKRIARWVSALLCRVFQRFATASEIIPCFSRPLAFQTACTGLYLGLFHLSRSFWPEQAGLVALLGRALRIGIILSVFWGLTAAADPLSRVILGVRKALDKTLVIFCAKILRVVLLLLALVMILRETGYDITGLITGLGLGGLTFALAAQDTASNLFGGFIIIADKPFAVDDWIQTPDLEGIVSDITLRSTRIRTFKDAEVIVPNSVLANTSITNWSRMSKRRVHFTLNLVYGTPQSKLHQAVDGIKEICGRHPEEILPDSAMVVFDQFGAYSLDLAVYYFVKLTSWADYTRVKQTINFEIREYLNSLGVELAYPTQLILRPESPEKEERQ